MELQKFEEKIDLKVLNQLKSDYEKLIVTRSNLKEVDEARKKLKRIRLEIQGVTKANKAIIKDMLDKNQKKEEDYLLLIEPIEERLNAEQKVIEAEIEKEKQEAEAKRQRIENELKLIREKVSNAPLLVYVNILEGYKTLELPAILVGTGREEEWNYELERLKQLCDERIEYLHLKAKQQKEEEDRIKAEKEKKIAEEAAAKKKLDEEALKVANAMFDDEPNPELVKEDNAEEKDIEHVEVEETRSEFRGSSRTANPFVRNIEQPSSGPKENIKKESVLEYMGYRIVFDAKMDEELFNECADAIRVILDSHATDLDF
jgi:hypothetical protein